MPNIRVELLDMCAYLYSRKIGREAGLLRDHYVVKKWKDFQMPMKLRLFAEKVHGTRIYPPWNTK